MRVDVYTKVVLTIIAACLVWMCVSGLFVTPAAAQRVDRQPTDVVVVGTRGPVPIVAQTPVPVVTPARTSLVVRPGAEWYADALPIEAPIPLPTRLTGIERQPGPSHWDPVDVNVKQQPRKSEPGH